MIVMAALESVSYSQDCFFHPWHPDELKAHRQARGGEPGWN